jgi:hypothetical protein
MNLEYGDLEIPVFEISVFEIKPSSLECMMLPIKSEQECNRGQWHRLNINAQFELQNCYNLKLNGFSHITIFR